jgi:membrane protein implicated in regulation of membrane protease activity
MMNHLGTLDVVRLLLVSLGTMLLSFAVSALLLVLLPARCLTVESRPPSPGWRAAMFRGSRNAFGMAVFVAGVVLSLPGIPFPGLPVALVGLACVDLPLRRRLQRKVLKRYVLMKRINRLRGRFGREPLELDPDSAMPGAV